MPLLRLPEAFDHPDWLFEVKHDGFRALAHIDGHHCDLVSRNGHTFKHWPQLCEELAHAVKAHDAVSDGEIVCLDGRGRSNFKRLLFRHEWPCLHSFNFLAADGKNLREWPLVERKRRLRRLIPSVPTRLLYMDRVEARRRTSSRSRVRTTWRASWASSRVVGTCGPHEHQLDQDQESRVHANDGSPRIVRAPNRFAQVPSDAARPVKAVACVPAAWPPAVARVRIEGRPLDERVRGRSYFAGC